jgi:high affinity choline transporter 7
VVGGLWSVAYTDVVQLGCILLGLVIALPFAISAVGGSEAVLGTFAEMPGFPEGKRVVAWIDLGLMLTLGGIPWQVYFQRVLSSPSPRAAANLSLLAALGCLLMAIPPVFFGAVGRSAAWPTGTMPDGSLNGGTLSEPALVLPYVLRYLTPPLVATIGLGAVAAAVMSSVDSSILSGSSMFAWNAYRPLLRPAARDRELRWAVRGAVLVIGSLATWLALTVRSVYDLWALCADLVYVILFPQLVMVLFCARVNRTGAIAGALVGLTLRLAGGSRILDVPALLPFQEYYLPPRTLAMLSSLATIWLVSLATQHWDRPRPLVEEPGPAGGKT